MKITNAKLTAAFDRRDARQANERNAELLRQRFAGTPNRLDVMAAAQDWKRSRARRKASR